jgi:2-oxoglutarate ferredoxin oxidoreductase subunit delta
MSPGSGGLPAAPHFQRTPMLPAPATVRGRVLIARERCKGCELCIEFCPHDVLVRSEQFNAKGYHYPIATADECINCRLCVTVCPEYAIFSIPATSPGGHP